MAPTGVFGALSVANVERYHATQADIQYAFASIMVLYVPGRIKSRPQSANQHTNGGTNIMKPNMLARNAVPTGTAKPNGSRIHWKKEKNTCSKKRLTFEKRVSFRRGTELSFGLTANRRREGMSR